MNLPEILLVAVLSCSMIPQMSAQQHFLSMVSGLGSTCVGIDPADCLQYFEADDNRVRFVPFTTNMAARLQVGADWCKAALNGNKLKLKLAKNTSDEPRETQIVIEGRDRLSETIKIYQLGGKDALLVKQQEIRLLDDTLSFCLDIFSNQEYEVNLPSWIKEVAHKEEKGTTTYRLCADAMNEAGERRDTIRVTSKALGQTINVPVRQHIDLDLHDRLAPVPRHAVVKDEDYIIWGASCIKGNDNKYHLFYSRWKKTYGFGAWVSHSEIAHAVADSLNGKYVYQNTIIGPRGREYWDGTTGHNPCIRKFGDTYYLYYMGNTGDGKITGRLNYTHRNAQRIGVATTKDLNGVWTRRDAPTLDVTPSDDAPDALVVTNPAVTQMPDGRYLMVYKAVGKKKPLPFGGPVVHCAAISDHPDGPWVKQDRLIFYKDGAFFPAEDPFIWTAGDMMYAIVKDFSGTFTHQGLSLALFESYDGLDWVPSKHVLASPTVILWADGTLEPMSRLERPQLYVEDGVIKALFAAAAHGDMRGSYNVHIPIRPLQIKK